MKKIIWVNQPHKVLRVSDSHAAILGKSKEYTIVDDSELVEVKDEEKDNEPVVAEDKPKPRRRRRKKAETKEIIDNQNNENEQGSIA